MSRRINKQLHNIIRFGYFQRDLYILKKSKYYKTINQVPPLILMAERLGLKSLEEHSFNGYKISSNMVGEYLYQLKMFLKWNTNLAYSDFRKWFVIDMNSTNEMKVIYKELKKQKGRGKLYRVPNI